MGKRVDYDPYGQFMLRAPLFPVEFLSSIPLDSIQLLPWLKVIWNNPLVREAIMLGSYDFCKTIEHYFNNPTPAIVDTRIHHSLLKYLCRFSSRCTPFGTFAGFAIGNLGMKTSILLDCNSDHALHARPDMEYLMGVARHLECDPLIQEKLLYSANTTLYRVGATWHYIEGGIKEGSTRKLYDVVTVSDDNVIGELLNFCLEGRKLDEIRAHLIGQGWAEAEVLAFVQSLVTSQVIVSSLEPVICGPEYIDYLIERLIPDFGDHLIFKLLVDLKCLFEKMNQPAKVIENEELVNLLLAKIPVPLNRNHLIQVDMKLSHTEMFVDSKTTGQVLLGLRIIKSLSNKRKPDLLKGFRDAFFRRFGEQKISLVKALDPETGIGLEGVADGYWTDPLPWIDDLHWEPPITSGADAANAGHPWLSEKFFELKLNQQVYLTLDSSDLNDIGIHQGNWANQMTAMVELFDSEFTGEQHIHFLLGSSGNPSYLLGRFGFADSDSIRDWICQLKQEELDSNPDELYAEVVHLPEDRTGNVLQRPSFLDYEIPYLARSVKNRQNQIPISDLLVHIKNQEVVLTSLFSGKRIRPCMTNAYNHQKGTLSLYKFLNRLEMQHQEFSFQPDWGDVIKQSSFIPGIRFKNLVLSAPIWVIRVGDIAKWFHSERNEMDSDEIIAYKNGRQMPDEMTLMTSDQELYFQWTNVNLMMALWDSISKLAFIRVRPFFLSTGTPVKSPGGAHANQFIFSFRKSK
jgi:lantibiotic biosynthesis protein